ncbi:hypothetical protein Ahy_B04g072142 [Arachis hypogaea]|uniref:Uncharacterized protein n=1 Tax=Arachis hypogaea TaxID=3818 RepID=A0A444ZMK5_ARAHY|nr:hypothetical protein Ahy_B04g072142 [Arachis hypogaea]
MRAHPNHIIKKYSSSNLLIIPPHADLHRGNIYFLVPLPPPPNQHAAADQKLSTPLTQAPADPAVLLSEGLISTPELRDGVEVRPPKSKTAGSAGACVSGVESF